MNQEKTEKDKIYTFIMIGISIFAISIVNILYNAWISKGPRVFYDDDLGVVSSYIRDGNLFNFTFSLASNKLRPVSNLVIWLVLQISGKNFELIDEVLLGLHFIAGCTMYGIAYKLLDKQEAIKRNMLSLVCAVVFISSRFAYYNISEMIGIMEGLGNIFAVLILYFILKYVDNENDNNSIILATIFYGFALYTHERYFILILLEASGIMVGN